MQKQIVLLMDREYPFTQDNLSPRESFNILVRQTLPLPHSNRPTTLAKANFVKNLKNKYLVKVDSLLEQNENTLHIMYEYVENKLINVLRDASLLLVNKIYAQLSEFGRYLSNIGVRIIFRVERIGVTAKECLKYFMGLDFDWEEDPDEQFLQQFYQKQTKDLLGEYLKKHPAQPQLHHLTPIPQPAPTQNQISIAGNDESKLRKVSYSTLPSRYNRICKIDQKLKEIKSSTRMYETQQIGKKNAVSVEVFKSQGVRGRTGGNKHETRKYSGEVQYELESRDKLFEKQSDIQSEYWQRKKRPSQKLAAQQENRSQAETIKTKSRTDEMKEKQYREISSMKKDYLIDIKMVLEEEEDHILPRNINDPVEIEREDDREKGTKSTFKKTNSFTMAPENSSEELQIKAKEAIKHSIKVMSRFKTLMLSSHEP